MTKYIHGKCGLCAWKGQGWLTQKLAENESVWHVYQKHPMTWYKLLGRRMPAVPDPRRLN